MLPYVVLLHDTEFHQLLRKGQLHALPPARFIATSEALQVAPWLTVLPRNPDGRWVILGSVHNQLPLPLEHTDFDHPIPLTEEQARTLQPAFHSSSTEQESWLQELWKKVKAALWIKANAPYGLLVVPRLGGARPEQQATLDLTTIIHIRPDQVASPETWAAYIPDVADDDQAIIFTLTAPLSDPLAVTAVKINRIEALTERGKRLLVDQAGYHPEQVHTTYSRYIQPVLDERRRVDAHSTAWRLLQLIQLTSAVQKKLLPVQERIAHSFTQSRSDSAAAQPPKTFWDALLSYERTGEGAEGIPHNSRGYLLDLGNIIKQFFKAEKARGATSDSDNLAIRNELNAWGQVIHDTSLNDKAAQIFNSKSNVQKLIAALNRRTSEADVNSIATGYLFLYLRDRTGNQETDLTPKFLAELQQFSKANKLEKELALALFALGLMEPSHRFMAVFREMSAEWLERAVISSRKHSAVKSKARTPSMESSANSVDQLAPDEIKARKPRVQKNAAALTEPDLFNPTDLPVSADLSAPEHVPATDSTGENTGDNVASGSSINLTVSKVR